MAAWGKRDDMVVHDEEPYNAEPPPAALATRLTPGEAFYSRNHGPVPRTDPKAWRLRVDGLVAHPLELTLEQLRERHPAHSEVATLMCAGNRRADLDAVRAIPGEDLWGPGAISTARWTGVRLADVLAEAGVRPGGAHVALSAPDVSELADPPQPFGGSIDLVKAQSPEVLLAWAMNGAPLAPEHGAPLRLVVPGWIGARSVKWLQRVTVQAEPSGNWFQAHAYRLLPADADPAESSRGLPLTCLPLTCALLSPAAGASLPAGDVEVTGYAVAGDGRGVARVDVSPDGGHTWVQAELTDPDGAWAWRHWRTVVELVPGPVQLVARAWDTAGTLQPASAEDVWNPKGYANGSWARADVVVASSG